MNNPGLYVHVPFCIRKCAYCNFYSLPAGEDEMADYLRALKRQIRQTSQGLKGRVFDSVYVGGGTPSILPARMLAEIFDALREAFAIAPGAEITLEANPATLDAEKLRVCRRSGINRLSVGVQSANDGTLSRLGRLHTFSQARESVLEAAGAGFENLSVDLMSGLPGQSVEELERGIREACLLPITHLSLYGLKVEENTPFGRDRTLRLPDEDAQCEMYERSARLLEELGFRRYEISNFARPGYESRHNLKYWKRCDYLGLGPAAHSFVSGVRFCFSGDLSSYLREDNFSLSFLEGSDPERTPYKQISRISEREAREEELMLGLRLTEGVPLPLLYSLAQDPVSMQDEIALLQREGYAVVQDGRFSLTLKGTLLDNYINTELLLR